MAKWMYVGKNYKYNSKLRKWTYVGKKFERWIKFYSVQGEF